MTPELTPAELRELLDEACIDIHAAKWPVPCVIAAGHVYEPHPRDGFLVVDGERCYSAAWL